MNTSRTNRPSAPRRAIATAAGAVVEQLEGRRLLSASAVDAYVTMDLIARSPWLHSRAHAIDWNAVDVVSETWNPQAAYDRLVVISRGEIIEGGYEELVFGPIYPTYELVAAQDASIPLPLPDVVEISEDLIKDPSAIEARNRLE